MNIDEQNLFNVVLQYLVDERANGNAITQTFINQACKKFIVIFENKNIDLNLVQENLEANFSHINDEQTTGIFDNDDHEPWLESTKGEIEWKFWNRFVKFKRGQPGFTQASVDVIDDITDKVLSSLENPKREGPWDRRGLVIGHVQSGKTSTYTGLINKAADAGYKYFVILAGLHNNLRAQTQVDIDQGFLGKNSLTKKVCGVHHFDETIKTPDAFTNQSNNGDFKTAAYRGSLINLRNDGIKVLVIKKNVTPLKNLVQWFAENTDNEEFIRDTNNEVRKYFSNESLLVIDDESDQASVDTKKQDYDLDGESDPEHEPTKINENIRKLLNMFNKSAYVGFTATPFANILINEKSETLKLGRDLFPSSFIFNIPPQNNYYGAEKVFGLKEDSSVGIEAQAELPIIEIVKDHIDKDCDPEEVDEEMFGWMPPKIKSDHEPLYEGQFILPPSLRGAIKEFLLATAIRRIREKKTIFNTMLIHVTRLSDVQHRVTLQVREYLKELQNEIPRDLTKNGIIYDLKNIWEENFKPKINFHKNKSLKEVTWDEIIDELKSSTASIVVREINGKAKDILEYQENEAQGWNVIAIGGEKLSRGVVLKGLTISYFLRSSNMYDTLMQMGRWFGYKEDYIDVSRLYLTKELKLNFKNIANATKELRDDFDYMAEIGSKPTDFGIKIRSHPGLLVTSKTKMRAGQEERISFQNKLTQTILYDLNEDVLKANTRATIDLIESNKTEPEKVMNTYVWRGFDQNQILTFLEKYITRKDAERVTPNSISKFIKIKNKKNELINWNVAISSVSIDKDGKNDFSNIFWNLDIGGPRRNITSKTDDQIAIGVLVNPIDEACDLSDKDHQLCLEDTIRSWKIKRNKNSSKEQPDKPSGRHIRARRKKENGLLLIYPLKFEDIREPVIGFAFSFPKSSIEDAVSYIVPRFQNEDYII